MFSRTEVGTCLSREDAATETKVSAESSIMLPQIEVLSFPIAENVITCFGESASLD